MTLRSNNQPLTRLRISERAICLKCGWRSPVAHRIGGDDAEHELDLHECMTKEENQ